MAVNPLKDKQGNIIPGCWTVDYYPKGRKGQRIIRRLGTPEKPVTENMAYSLWLDLVRVSRGQCSKVNPRIVELLPDWKEHCKNNLARTTYTDICCHLVPLIKFFGSYFFGELCGSLIEQYKAQRLQTEKATPIRRTKRKKEELQALDNEPRPHRGFISKRTINKELSYFSSFISWAVENDHANPVQFKIKKFPAKQVKAATPRVLHPDEATQILAHLEPEYRCCFLLMNDAGLRWSEVLGSEDYTGVRVKDIDFENDWIYVRGKGNKERIVPIITDRLRQALEWEIARADEMREKLQGKYTVKEGELFISKRTGRRFDQIRKPLARAAEKAGIEKRVYQHLLRHNFGTHLTLAGASLRAVQNLMGHSSSKVTEMYTHLAGTFLRSEGMKLNDLISTTAGGRAGNTPKNKKDQK